MNIAKVYVDGELVDELRPDDPDNVCYGYGTGHTGEMCGGCDGCLLMQAAHYGCKIEWEEECEN
jgi:hypothetical protein